MLSKESENYITLKEAAKMSGYAPDYIGQLIRKGKLPGKQVYCSVAWVTTEAAVKQYTQSPQIKQAQSKQKKLPLKGGAAERFCRKIKTWAKEQMKFTQVYRTVLCLSIIFSVGFSLVLLYIFSVNLDNKLEQRAIQKIEAKSQKAISSI